MPKWQEILANGQDDKHADPLLIATTKEQLGRAEKYVNDGLNRLRNGSADAGHARAA
jgi:hypothetical protein